MYSIRADKNCLILSLKGFMEDKLVAEASKKTKSEANKLKTEFTIINDISEFKPTTTNGSEKLKKHKNMFSKKE